MVRAMLYGRGSRWAELRALGASLREQFERLYPGMVGVDEAACNAVAPPTFKRGKAVSGNARLPLQTRLPSPTGHGGKITGGENDPEALLSVERPRALELLNFVFNVRDVSLACVTHFARHRMQSPMYMPTLDALARGNYVLPERWRPFPEARAATKRPSASRRTSPATWLRAACGRRSRLLRPQRPHGGYALFHERPRTSALFQTAHLRARPVGDPRRGAADASAAARLRGRIVRRLRAELSGDGTLPRGAAQLRTSAQAGRRTEDTEHPMASRASACCLTAAPMAASIFPRITSMPSRWSALRWCP